MHDGRFLVEISAHDKTQPFDGLALGKRGPETRKEASWTLTTAAARSADLPLVDPVHPGVVAGLSSYVLRRCKSSGQDLSAKRIDEPFYLGIVPLSLLEHSDGKASSARIANASSCN